MTLRMALMASLLLGLTLGLSPSAGQQSGAKAILLNVGKDQLPPDTGMDDKTKSEIVTDVKELGAKALKVPFAAGDSIGSRAGSNTNWRRFATFRFDAVNPGKEPVVLELMVAHAGSRNYQTRAVAP